MLESLSEQGIYDSFLKILTGQNNLDVGSILFELSAQQRYETLELLAKNEIRPSDVANRLGLSRSETSRHLSRLAGQGLVERTPRGYRATFFGLFVTQEFKAIEFFLKERKYFEEHMWELLPKTLLHRIGALSEAQFVRGVSNVLKGIETMLRSCNAYLLFLTCEMPDNFIIPLLQGLGRGVKMSILMTEEASKQLRGFFRDHPEYDADLLKRADIKLVDEMFSCAGISDGSACTGLVSRTDPTEHFTTHFFGNSVEFREWCRDAFKAHEERSKLPITEQAASHLSHSVSSAGKLSAEALVVAKSATDPVPLSAGSIAELAA